MGVEVGARSPEVPARSKAQARFMRAVASGDVKAKGLSRSQAKEYVEGHPTKRLPARKGRKS